MDFEQWLDKYQPIKNPHVDDAPFDGIMFETYGKEWEQVLNTDPSLVWTWVEDGEGSAITNGISIVNRQGYFISERPYDEAESVTDIALDDDADDDAEI